MNIFVQLAAKISHALNWCREAVQVLAPVRQEFLNSHGPLGVITTVLQTKLLPGFDDGIVNVDGELVGDVKEEAKLPRVGEIHGQDVGGAGHVHLATREEGEAL